jgi:hypothetical protein
MEDCSNSGEKKDTKGIREAARSWRPAVRTKMNIIQFVTMLFHASSPAPSRLLKPTRFLLLTS